MRLSNQNDTTLANSLGSLEVEQCYNHVPVFISLAPAKILFYYTLISLPFSLVFIYNCIEVKRSYQLLLKNLIDTKY